AGRGGAVDGADDGDVVARGIAEVVPPLRAAIVAHPEARLRCRGSGRTVAAEGVIALEGVGGDVMDMDVIAGRDVLAGEADDLAVLVDRLALLDGPQGDLVAETDPAGQGERLALVIELLPGGERAGGDGDIVFGTQV